MSFFDDDKPLYLERLIDSSDKDAATLLAFCLSDGHLHLVWSPSNKEGLIKVLKSLPMSYAQYVNQLKSCTGHLWQGRFFSSALDKTHSHAAVRSVQSRPQGRFSKK